MAFTYDEPNKNTRSGATGADVTKANFNFLHDVFDAVGAYVSGGVFVAGYDDATPASTVIKGLHWLNVSAAHAAAHREMILVDTSAGAVTVTLPAAASASVGDWVAVADMKKWFHANNLTLTSTAKIDSSDSDKVFDTQGEGAFIIYISTDIGWQVFKFNQSSLGEATSAAKLTTPRNIELIGDVTGIVAFDGSAAVQIDTTVVAASAGKRYAIIFG
jgi:hypothetical protein